MNLTEIENRLSQAAFCEDGLISKVTKILRTCERSKNLMIGIYLIEQDHFLHANQNLKKNLGEDATRLLKEGWDYWFSLVDPVESIWVKHRVLNYLSLVKSSNPLLLKYHITVDGKKRITLKHEIILHRLDDLNLAINYFFDMSDKERLESCFSITADNNLSSYFEKCPLNISSREREVLLLVADGFSSKQIADMLFISNHTAISHRKNLIEKFGVKNTAQLIKKASKVMEL